MISLWFCNIGEDFIIEKYREDIEILTYDNNTITLKNIGKTPLSVVGKDKETILAVYKGHRLAFNKKTARTIHGIIKGQTEKSPQILHIPEDCCGHGCSKCGGCGHC